MPSQRRNGSAQAVQERGIHAINDQERLQAARAQRLINQAQENPQSGRVRLGQKNALPPGRHYGASTAPRPTGSTSMNQRSGSNVQGNNRGPVPGSRSSNTLPSQSAQAGSSHVHAQRARSASTSNDKYPPKVKNNKSRKNSNSQVSDSNHSGRQRSVSASEVLDQSSNVLNANRTTHENIGNTVQGNRVNSSTASSSHTNTRPGSANNSSVFVAPSTSQTENRQQSGSSDSNGPSGSSVSTADPNIVLIQYVKSSNRQGNSDRSSNSSPRNQNVSEQRDVQNPVTSQPESNNLDILNDSRSNRDSPLSEEQVQVNLSERNDQTRIQLQESNNAQTNEALPDILNSHRVGAPPYVPRPNQHRARNHRGRSSHAPSRRSVHGTTQLEEDERKRLCTKECCLSCVTVVTTFRWVLVTLAMLGVCCVATGIILGALHMTEDNSYLTLSLMFIGLGVMLVVVVGVGWRCTPPGHEPCHLLFNLGEHTNRDIYGRGGRPRHHRERGWMGGMMYNEFQYRRPPPSYNASMQDYQHQLAAAQNVTRGENVDNVSLPSSPPPTYRSRASTVRTGVQITFPPTTQGGDYPSSGPPTYRSRVSTNQRPSIQIEVNDVDVGVDNPAMDSDPGESISARQSPERNLGTPDSNLQAPLGGETSTLPSHVRVVEYLEGMQDTEQEAVSNAESLDSAAICQEEQDTARNRSVSMNSDVERVADTRL